MSISESLRDQLVRRACEIRQRAYAKYSKYPVGASLLAADGSIHDGVNVENASFGLTICAERTAVFSAITTGQQQFHAIAIASDGGFAPCGACRQVLTEFTPELVVFLVDPANPNSIREFRLEELLPGRFEFPKNA